MPTSSLGLALDGLIVLVANSSTFQTRVSAGADAVAARKSIQTDIALVDDPADTLRALCPFALVTELQHGYQGFAQGVGLDMGVDGALFLKFMDVANEPDNHTASKLDFVEFFSNVVDEIAANFGLDNGTVNFYPFKDVGMVTPSGRTARKDRIENNDFWEVNYQLSFGVSQ